MESLGTPGSTNQPIISWNYPAVSSANKTSHKWRKFWVFHQQSCSCCLQYYVISVHVDHNVCGNVKYSRTLICVCMVVYRWSVHVGTLCVFYTSSSRLVYINKWPLISPSSPFPSLPPSHWCLHLHMYLYLKLKLNSPPPPAKLPSGASWLLAMSEAYLAIHWNINNLLVRNDNFWYNVRSGLFQLCCALHCVCNDCFPSWYVHSLMLLTLILCTQKWPHPKIRYVGKKNITIFIPDAHPHCCLNHKTDFLWKSWY